jgi:hypothetical protein
VWIEAFCGLVKEWQPREWAEEKGQIHAGLGPFIDKRQRETQAWCYRRDFPVRADKAVRARSIQGRMAGPPGLAFWSTATCCVTGAASSLLPMGRTRGPSKPISDTDRSSPRYATPHWRLIDSRISGRTRGVLINALIGGPLCGANRTTFAHTEFFRF